MQDTEFYRANIEPLEQKLLGHDIGKLFSGELYLAGDQPFISLVIEDFDGKALILDAQTVGRLFMAVDGSIINVSELREQTDGSPAGVNVSSDSPIAQENEPFVVIAYRQTDGLTMRVDSLHISRLMVDEGIAPVRFCTVAFGIMAITAYKLGFNRITLYAAGRGPITLEDSDEMIGYFVWPKFGFDASLEPVDIQNAPNLKGCKSVQDIICIDP